MRTIQSQCVSALTCLLIWSTAQAQQVQVSKDNRTIMVSATGNASTSADAATVHIGFQVYGPDSVTAYARGSKASNEITAALARAGVPKDAIESKSQSIAEAQPYEMNNLPAAQRVDRAFKLQQSWTVKTDASEAGRVLDIAVKAGGNASGQIDWSMKDQDALHAKAMQDAMSRARKNAEAVAAGMGVKLGALMYASNDRPPQFDRVQQYAMLQSAPPPDGRALQKLIPLAVNARKIDDSATVYAVFAIE